MSLNPEFIFQGTDERLKEIDRGGFTRQDHLADLGIDDGAEDDRALPRLFLRVVDMLKGVLRLPHGVDEGKRDLLELHVVELDEKAVAERLGRNRRAVGNKENGSFDRHGSSRLSPSYYAKHMSCKAFFAGTPSGDVAARMRWRVFRSSDFLRFFASVFSGPPA
jgi:hypothetical protein